VGWFEFLRRKPARPLPPAAPSASAAPTLTSDQLRDAIVDAHSRQDGDRLQYLFNHYTPQIKRDCMSWTKCPDERAQDRKALEQYINALGWLCEVMKSNGDSRLYDALVGGEADNPLLRWDRVLEDANAATESADADDFDRAITSLEDMLIETRQLTGPGMEQYVPITHGRLGILTFGRGRVELARGHFETALRLCREYKDDAGVRAYLNSLYEVNRYLGDASRAAEYADESANAHENAGDKETAARLRRQASIVRAGEPLLRVKLSIDGRPHEVDDVATLQITNAGVQFHFERNRLDLTLAKNLAARGQQLGSAGKHAEALAEFRAASAIDAFAPQPHYDGGFSLMHLERYSDAAQEYETCERLAPGWFNCRGDGFLAREFARGRWPHAAFVAITLEDAGPQVLAPKEKLAIATRAAELAPDLARVHLLRGRTLESMNRKADATVAYRAGLECPEEDPDTKTRLLLHMGVLADAPEEKRALLQQASELAAEGNLIAATMALVTMRAGAT
jgi:tetratricopeptide (TPR) repeat protein